MSMLQMLTGLAVLLISNIQLAATAAVNPSGNCTTNDNGGRVGYHSPDPTVTYLPDCQNPLERELYRVFQQEDGTAYMIPRPDGLGLVYGICGDSDPTTDAIDPDLISKSALYGLCDEVVTNVATINSMDPADALRLAHFFHQQLVFVMDESSGRLQPWAPDVDILAACESSSLAAIAAAESYCAAVQDRCNDNGECVEIGIEPSEEAVAVLAPALNELYGISVVEPTGPSSGDGGMARSTSGSVLLGVASLFLLQEN